MTVFKCTPLPFVILAITLTAGTLCAGGKTLDDLAAPRDKDFHFLKGDGPGDWLDRQKWSPGFAPDSTKRLWLAYSQPPQRAADSCCPAGTFSGAFQTRAGSGVWGAYMDLDRLGLNERESLDSERNDHHLAGEAGIWLAGRGRYFKGARLAFGGEWTEEAQSETVRTGDFGGIRNFSKQYTTRRAASIAFLGSPMVNQHLRLSFSLSEAQAASDTGNEVAYDNEAFRRFNSVESQQLESATNHFGFALNHITLLKGGSLVDLNARTVLIDGHGIGNEVIGDSTLVRLGGKWLAKFNFPMVAYQIAPGADFEMVLFNTSEQQTRSIGFLRAWDEDRSRKAFTAQAPQRVTFNLNGNLKLLLDWNVSVEYWNRKIETLGKVDASSVGADIEIDLDAPTLYFGAAGSFSMAFTPKGSFDSPGGNLVVSFQSL